MTTIQFVATGKTDVGLKRAENEDTFLLVPELRLYILADGMGGHSSGKLASTLAVRFIRQFIEENVHDPDPEWPYDPDPSLTFKANLLVNAIKFANERVFIEGCKNSEATGMGTTVTAIYESDREIVLAHVGDSRIYRMRDGALHQLTEDHSLANHLLRTGKLRPQDVDTFKHKNVIMRAIGLKDYVDVETRSVERRAGDTFMMCSDGLSDLVNDRRIREALNAQPRLGDVCDTLVQHALDAGGKDNITVVCIRLEQSGGRQIQRHPIAPAAQPKAMERRRVPATLDLPIVNATPSRRRAPAKAPVRPPPTPPAALRSQHAVRRARMTLQEARARLKNGQPVESSEEQRFATPPQPAAAPPPHRSAQPKSRASAAQTLEEIPTFTPPKSSSGARDRRTTLKDLPAVGAKGASDPFGAFPDPWGND